MDNDKITVFSLRPEEYVNLLLCHDYACFSVLKWVEYLSSIVIISSKYIMILLSGPLGGVCQRLIL